MNQQQANNLIHELGVLILLDAPSQIQLGIDNTQWIVGKKFKGIKLIPLGVHYIHYSMAEEKYQFKLGFFCIFSKECKIIVKKWNSQYEDFLEVDQEERQKYEHVFMMNDLDNYLGPYPHERWDVWVKVSNYIDQGLLDKLNPAEPQLYMINEEYQDPSKQIEKEEESNSEEDEVDVNVPNEKFEMSNSDPLSFNMEAELSVSDQQSEGQMRTGKDLKKEVQSNQQKEDFKILAGTTYYTDIPSRRVQHGTKGIELTRSNFDKSLILSELLQKEYGNNYKLLLGELQYAFIKFLLGEHYDSFEQWKKLFILITSCDELVDSNPGFYVDFIPVVYNQLQQIPKDFFVDPLSGNSFVKACLNNFFEICDGQYTGDRKKVQYRAEKLKEMIQKQFIFGAQPITKNRPLGDNEDDDDAPVLVQDFEFIQI